MERTWSKTAALNAAALLVGGGVMIWMDGYARSTTASGAAAFFVIGALVSLACWFQMRLEARVEAERIEIEELARARGGAALFADADPASFTAALNLRQFERWLAPAFTLLLCLGEAFFAWRLYRTLAGSPEVIAAPEPTLPMAVAFGVALVLFLLGKYSARLAQLEQARLLRPGGAALLLGALVAATAGGAAAADWFGFPRFDRIAAWVLVGLLALLSVETLAALILELYRPRTAGTPARPLFESRLIGMLGESGSLFGTVAQALDYQFGFKVSETWVYAFFRDNLLRLTTFWVALLAVCSCIVVIEPGEQGLLERFGKPGAAGPLPPGLHLKLPWPIDLVERVATDRLQSFNIGFVPDPRMADEKVLVWTRQHYLEEFNLLVASQEQGTNAADSEAAIPVNLLSVSIPVQYYVRDARAWAYGHERPAELLERIANREVVRYMASVDMDRIMSYGRWEASGALRAAIQARADEVKLGVDVVFVGLQDIHPPLGSKRVQVASAFEQVIGAEAEREATIYQAEAYAADSLPRARAEAVRRVEGARGDAARKLGVARGQAAQFAGEQAALVASPSVFRRRSYLTAMAAAVGPRRKIIMGPTNTHDVIWFNFEQKISDELLDRTVVEDPDKKK